MKHIVVCMCVCLVAILILMGFGSYAITVGNSRKVPIYNVATERKVASISFDAAWGADKTMDILNLCDQYDVKATFFLVGFWIDKYPDMVQEIDRRGHEIGTHSVTHPKMTTLSIADMDKELTNSSTAITNITGKPVTLFRAPFGDYNNDVIDRATALGLYTIQWSIDSLDWKGLSGVEIATRIQKAKEGDIILCHNNSDHIVDALPLVFECIRAKGIQLVPIGELIYTDQYHIDNNGTQHNTLS